MSKQKKIVNKLLAALPSAKIDKAGSTDGEIAVRFDDQSVVFVTADGEVY